MFKMNKANERVPIAGREALVITHDGQEIFGVRMTADLWQNLLCTDTVHPAYGRFKTEDVFAWGYLSSREWRIENVSQTKK